MHLSDTQKEILRITSAKARYTAGDLANCLGSKAGPISRSASSLVDKGLLRIQYDKDDNPVYTRTADGSKIAKSL